MPPELGGQIRSAPERNYIYDQAFGLNLVNLSPEYIERSTHLKGSGEVFAKLWR
jgi:hypothetical protein